MDMFIMHSALPQFMGNTEMNLTISTRSMKLLVSQGIDMIAIYECNTINPKNQLLTV